MKKLLFLVLISFTLLACSSDDDASPENLQLRISNVSAFDYDNIQVSTTGDLVDFGDLAAGSSSEYIVFDSAYRYGFVEFQIDGETFTYQPIDYVGETLLENGKYAYEIDVDIENQRVLLSLKVE